VSCARTVVYVRSETTPPTIVMTGADTCDYTLREIVDKLWSNSAADSLYTAVQRTILAGDMVKCVRTLYDFAMDASGTVLRWRWQSTQTTATVCASPRTSC